MQSVVKVKCGGVEVRTAWAVQVSPRLDLCVPPMISSIHSVLHFRCVQVAFFRTISHRLSYSPSIEVHPTVAKGQRYRTKHDPLFALGSSSYNMQSRACLLLSLLAIIIAAFISVGRAQSCLQAGAVPLPIWAGPSTSSDSTLSDLHHSTLAQFYRRMRCDSVGEARISTHSKICTEGKCPNCSIFSRRTDPNEKAYHF